MKDKSFNIIRYRGQQNKAQLPNGTWIERADRLWVEEYGLVMCAPYDDHFIFRNPNKKEIGSLYQCTCGSMAVVVGPQGYLYDASPQGKMLVCHHHATHGIHATGGTKWI